ncbi:MAG: hypothetical protein FWC22_03160 [Treponema sp.]|nr:hypothetical protein [Treponema sp.]
MLLKRKKEEPVDQLATFQERKAPRWGAPNFELDAGICITGFEGEGQLGNISVTGCSMKSVTYVNIIPDEVYKVKIIPGKDYDLNPFSLNMKLSWTKSSETIFLAGFSLEGSDGGGQLKNYVEMLRSRGLEPDYGNMKQNS